MGVSAMLMMQTADVPIRDNEVLNHWTIPFGEWMRHIIDWLNPNHGGAFDSFARPFR